MSEPEAKVGNAVTVQGYEGNIGRLDEIHDDGTMKVRFTEGPDMGATRVVSPERVKVYDGTPASVREPARDAVPDCRSDSAAWRVAAEVRRQRLAALRRDVPALEQLWSEHFTVNAPNNRVVVGRRSNLDTFVRSGIINFSSFERTIEFVRVDGNFAVVMGLETVVPNADAPSAGLVAGQPARRRFTNIWRRVAGTWRLYWRHANVIPPR